MSRRRAIRSAILTVALVSVAVPLVRAESGTLDPSVESAAGAILKSGYAIERQLVDATTVRVHVLRGGSILATATGRIGAPPKRVGERVPAGERALHEEPVLARTETVEGRVSTP